MSSRLIRRNTVDAADRRLLGIREEGPSASIRPSLSHRPSFTGRSHSSIPSEDCIAEEKEVDNPTTTDKPPITAVASHRVKLPKLKGQSLDSSDIDLDLAEARSLSESSSQPAFSPNPSENLDSPDGPRKVCPRRLQRTSEGDSGTGGNEQGTRAGSDEEEEGIITHLSNFTFSPSTQTNANGSKSKSLINEASSGLGLGMSKGKYSSVSGFDTWASIQKSCNDSRTKRLSIANDGALLPQFPLHSMSTGYTKTVAGAMAAGAGNGYHDSEEFHGKVGQRTSGSAIARPGKSGLKKKESLKEIAGLAPTGLRKRDSFKK